MRKHTPTPWLIAGEDKCFVYALGSQGTNAFWANVQAAGPERIEYTEKVANALLIAAAPDLLLACEEAMRLIELLEVLARSDADIYKHELRGDAELFRSRIAPAIAKATGEPA